MSHPFPTFIVGQSPPSAILQFSSLLLYLYNLCCSFFTLSSSPPTPVSFFPSLPAPTPGQAECAADISIAQSLRVVFLPSLPSSPILHSILLDSPFISSLSYRSTLISQVHGLSLRSTHSLHHSLSMGRIRL